MPAKVNPLDQMTLGHIRTELDGLNVQIGETAPADPGEAADRAFGIAGHQDRIARITGHLNDTLGKCKTALDGIKAERSKMIYQAPPFQSEPAPKK